MKKIILCFLFITASCILNGQDQSRNIFGVSGGFAPAIMDIYFDDPFDFWPNRELSPVANIFYARQVRESFRIGSYFEWEQVNFTAGLSPEKHNFERFNIGINWLGQFPKTKLHLQLGGYLGYGILKATDWDDPKGFDVGFIAGPAFETNHLGLALHVQSGHAWYESTGSPLGVMLYTPKYLLKIYYKM
jgi:hypothetical protein